MKITLSVLALAAGFGLATDAYSEEVDTKTPERTVVREDRPSDTRGWLVVAKAAYWPLCYEALDRIEKVRELSGSSNKEVLVAQLEKCSAWLQLAASASMVDEDAVTFFVQEELEGLAVSLEKPANVIPTEKINLLATMSEFAMARSHLVRSIPDDKSVVIAKAQRKVKSTASKIKLLGETEKEIQQGRMEMAKEQYRYDTGQSLKHLSVAKVYLNKACEHANVETDIDISGPTVSLTGKETTIEMTAISKDADNDATTLIAFIDRQQFLLKDKLKKLE